LKWRSPREWGKEISNTKEKGGRKKKGKAWWHMNTGQKKEGKGKG